MAIKSIQIKNVMVFQSQRKDKEKAKPEEDTKSLSKDGFSLHFCDGINVLIGENGVGKTTILKMIYAATQWSFEKKSPGKTKKLIELFSNASVNSEILQASKEESGEYYYKVSDGKYTFEDHLNKEGQSDSEEWYGLNIPAVFIPTTEMLSHAKGFLAMNQKYRMPFDGTQIDIIVNASLPETREIPDSCKAVLDEISKVIDGTVVQENDIFYVLKKDGRKVEFSLEAEGFRKLGLLWKLIRNGLLEKGSVLLWDEPEANLNPELYPMVANILLSLEENGVQIFIATHSYNFAKYLEIRRNKTEQVMFHNLYNHIENREGTNSETSEKEICGASAYKMEDLDQNHIMLADNKLLDEVYDM